MTWGESGFGFVTLSVEPALTPLNIQCGPSRHSSNSNNPDGEIYVDIQGGQAPFDILINTPQGTDMFEGGYGLNLINGMPHGLHHVTVISADGQESSCSLSIWLDPNTGCLENPVPTFTVTSSYDEATAQCCGSIDVSISGGTPPFSTYWSDLSNTDSVEDREVCTPGFYSAYVSDANGCYNALQANVSCQTACCLLYTSPSPRDLSTSRMPSSA